jgi:hypothetical protein
VPPITSNTSSHSSHVLSLKNIAER